MLNITALEDVLRAWVFGIVTPIETIFAHPNAPRPELPYVLINLYDSLPHGIEEHEYTLLGDDSIDANYSDLEELSVSINTYGASALQNATKIRDSLGRITVKDALWNGGLGYIRTSNIQEIPEEINKRWEERAQFDCFFYTRSLDEENIETIQKVEITNDIDGSTNIITKP